ncbi:uncharacterized protein [Euwallacea similis]|uniref:uncharacterized protein isoform X2 n=1 Tax=Euwallacea similis TaxID=1736056 RepID=UPI00344E9F11
MSAFSNPCAQNQELGSTQTTPRTYHKQKSHQQVDTSVLYCGLCHYFENSLEVPSNVYFFKFPDDPALGMQWKTALKLRVPAIPLNYAVCSLHFVKSNFTVGPSGISLKSDAVPSYNPSQKSLFTSNQNVDVAVPLGSTVPIQSILKRKWGAVFEDESEGRLFKAAFEPDSKEPKSSSFKHEKQSLNTLKTSMVKLKKKKSYYESIIKLRQRQFKELTSALNTIGGSCGISNLARKVTCTEAQIAINLGEKFAKFIKESESVYLLQRKLKLNKIGAARGDLIQPLEEINIEIVDDDSNILKQASIGVSLKAGRQEGNSNIPENVISQKVKFLREKLKELNEFETAKVKKIKQLKSILEEKIEIAQDLAASLGLTVQA